MELIFVDDFSTDNTKNIIESYKNQFSNIKLFSLNNNSGFAGKPRNIGLLHANAEYVMFFDPDDILLENCCELLYDKISSNNIDVVSGNYSIQNLENIIPWNHVNITSSICVKSIKDKPSLLILPPSVWSKIYRKDFLLDNNIYFNEKLPGQDALFVYEVLLKSKGILYFNESIALYLKRKDVNEKSITDDISFQRLKDYLEIYEKMYHTLKNFDSNYVIVLSSHLNYWSTLYLKTQLTSNQIMLLSNSFKDLLAKINKCPSNNCELLRLIGHLQVNSALNMLQLQNSEIKRISTNDSVHIVEYQEKIADLNNQLFIEQNSVPAKKTNKKFNISLIDEKYFNKQNIKISVIIPTHNSEKYLQYCLNSVLNQSFKDFEIICVDDASTDNTLNILEYYRKKNNNIKIIQNKTKMGVGASRNIGINNADGEYIQFLDSDDWLDEYSFEKLYDTVNKFDLDIVVYNLIDYDNEKDRFVGTDSNSMNDLNISFYEELKTSEIDAEILFKIPKCICNKLFKSSFIKENLIYFTEGLIYEQHPFFFETIFKSNTIIFIKDDFYTKRIHNHSLTCYNTKELLDSIKISEIVYIFFKENNLYKKLRSYVLNYIIDLFIKNYCLIEDKFKELYFNNMKLKIIKYENEYLLKEDFEKNLTPENKKFYNFIRNSESSLFEDFI